MIFTFYFTFLCHVCPNYPHTGLTTAAAPSGHQMAIVVSQTVYCCPLSELRRHSKSLETCMCWSVHCDCRALCKMFKYFHSWESDVDYGQMKFREIRVWDVFQMDTLYCKSSLGLYNHYVQHHLEETWNILTFSAISRPWDGTGSWNPSS